MQGTALKLDLILPNASTVEVLEEHLLEQIYTWVPGDETRAQLQSKYFFESDKDNLSTDDMFATVLVWDGGKGILLAIYSVLDTLITGLSTSRSSLNTESIDAIVEILKTGAHNGRTCVFRCVQETVHFRITFCRCGILP